MWKISFPSIAGVQIPAFLAKTAQRPNWSFEEWQIDYMSQIRYGAGKLVYEPMEVTLVESIDMSASQGFIAWSNLIFIVSDTAAHAAPNAPVDSVTSFIISVLYLKFFPAMDK